MALTTASVHDIANEVLACVCAALDEAAAKDETECLPGCPERTCVVPGTPAWDSCGEMDCPGAVGGQLTVHFVGIRPGERDRATLQMAARGCTPPPVTVAELVVTLLRCAPMPDDQGCPPTCEEMEMAARVLHADAVTVWQALTCCLPEISGSRRAPKWELLSGPQTVGPQGGCVGVEQRLRVTLPAVCCPGEESPSP
jgi:hypothetical protein